MDKGLFPWREEGYLRARVTLARGLKFNSYGLQAIFTARVTQGAFHLDKKNP